MAAHGDSSRRGAMAPGPYLDWAWAPLGSAGERVAPLGLNAGDEFMSFPPLVRGELLARIRRVIDGHARRGDTFALPTGLRGMSLQVGKTRHWVIYKVVDRRCVGLLCCNGTERKPTTQQLAEAHRRSHPATPMGRGEDPEVVAFRPGAEKPNL